MSIRLGDILIERGLITSSERDEILRQQSITPRPFGELAERMFGVSPAEVEEAWADQYSSYAEHVDPEAMEVDSRLLSLLERRQAWQFGILPILFDGNELVMCTSRRHLIRALKFVGWRLSEPAHFVLADPASLGRALMRHYPLDGMSPETAGYLDVPMQA